MLYDTLHKSKFSLLLLDPSPVTNVEATTDDLVAYRTTLNNFLKLIAKLNTAAEVQGKTNEVYKVKLVN